jgi:hypothetical protein
LVCRLGPPYARESRTWALTAVRWPRSHPRSIAPNFSLGPVPVPLGRTGDGWAAGANQLATLYVTEYSRTASVNTNFGGRDSPAQAPQDPPNAEQLVNIAASPTLSAIFTSTTSLIRVHSDAICSIAIGPNPTATTSQKRLAANQTEYFGVSPGTYISVIANV